MELKAKTRTVIGKKVKGLRKQGLVPAEIFGHGIKNRHISVEEKAFNDIYKTAGNHTVIQVSVEGDEKIPALISEVQIHPLTRQPLSVLIREVKSDETIETRIPIVFNGLAPAEKAGFVVVKVLDEIEIEALPGKIPHSFEVSLSELKEAGDGVSVGDLNVPEGVKILLPEDTVIVSITEKEKEEEVPAASAEAETAIAGEEEVKKETTDDSSENENS